MDEADELASRIGIMVKGQLTCLGTPQHLKTQNANHYKLSFQTADLMQTAAAIDALCSLFPGSELVEESASDNSTAACLNLPGSISATKVFEALKKQQERLGIIYYTVGQESMEQVILWICTMVCK